MNRRSSRRVNSLVDAHPRLSRVGPSSGCSQYTNLTTIPHTRPCDAVLPGGIATRRPIPQTPPPRNFTKESNNTLAHSLLGLSTVALIAVPFLDKDSFHSHIKSGVSGALICSGTYLLFKLHRRSMPKLSTGLLLCALGANGGILYNRFRILNTMKHWTKEYDDKSGNHYYFNTISGESTWEYPGDAS